MKTFLILRNEMNYLDSTKSNTALKKEVFNSEFFRKQEQNLKFPSNLFVFLTEKETPT